MKFFWITIISLFCISNIVFADNISAPPPFPKSDPSVSFYFKQIYDNFHRLQVVSSDPDGSRAGKKGDMVLYLTGGVGVLCINMDSVTDWDCETLED